MWFLDNIVTWLDSVSSYFLDAYSTVSGWVYPFNYLSTPLYWLYYAFYYLTYYFGQFNVWLDWAAGRIGVILSYDNIGSYFKWWFDAAQNAWSWVYNALYNVWNICNSWWGTTQYTVLSWIADAKSWSLSQVNSLRDTVWAWIGDVRDWTTTQVNTAQATILAIITNVQTWTTTQINTARDAILAVVGNLSTWTTAQVNTIQATLTTLINWTALTPWITTWWNSRLIDVWDIIGSAFAPWGSVWNEWQSIKGHVFAFFADPVEYIWQRFADWFLGPEE